MLRSHVLDDDAADLVRDVLEPVDHALEVLVDLPPDQVAHGVGVAVGLPVALLAGALLRSALYEVSAFDPLVLAGVPAVLGTVAALACWVPARRAARVNPVVALRAE